MAVFCFLLQIFFSFFFFSYFKGKTTACHSNSNYVCSEGIGKIVNKEKQITTQAVNQAQLSNHPRQKKPRT